MKDRRSGMETQVEFPGASAPKSSKRESPALPEMTGDEDPSKGLGLGVMLTPEQRLDFKVAHAQGQAEAVKRAEQEQNKADVERARNNVRFNDPELNAAAEIARKSVADSFVVTPPRDTKSRPPEEPSPIQNAWKSVKKFFGSK